MTDEEVNKIKLIEKVNEEFNDLTHNEIFDKLGIDLDDVISNELNQLSLTELIDLL